MRKIIALMAAGLLAVAAPLAAAKLEVDQPAPAFKIKTLDGEQLTLDDLLGEVVILNFWATWCGPCKRELPDLDAYYRVRRENGLRVFAVTTEGSVPLYQLKPLARLLAIPLVKGISGGPYARVSAVPTSYVIDRAGVLRYAKAGALDIHDLDGIVLPLLQEAAPAVTTTAPQAP